MTWKASRALRLTVSVFLLVGSGLAVLILGGKSGQTNTSVAVAATLSQRIYLPLVMRDYAPASVRLCRFGVDAGSDIASYRVNDLRIGWYLDWAATQNPARPGGITYLPLVRLQQTGPNSYSYSPSSSVLSAMVAMNPGAFWLIGNEPDRRRWQDDLEPQVYARAYHELYYLIKGLDSTAQIAAGGIVQPTPLRLQYLDMVLENYRQLYGEPMPVDVWNIHNFILRERSCDYYPEDCWGAEVPPGIDAPQGMLYDVQDNDNLDIFKQHIESFRQWMANRGYQDRPLIITEFGVQMPSGWFEPDFTPARVNTFMNATFDYLLTMTNTAGYPADGYRLVQRWSWYSLTDTNYNGWLFDPVSKARTVFGDNFATYTAQLNPSVNLAPVRIWTEPVAPFSSGEPVTLTLRTQIVNNGNVSTSGSTPVRFYDGDPAQGGTLIGTEQSVAMLDGCASLATAQVTWTNVTPGTHLVCVVADPSNSVAESNEADNVYCSNILVATSRLWMPLILRTGP